MNVINKGLLKLVLLPQKIYERWGVSIPHLQSILQYKLLMDDRRPNGIQQTRQRSNNSNKETNNSSVVSMFISIAMGLVFMTTFFLGEDNITHLTFYFSMFIVFLCMMLISDFTSVLIDVRDNYIILPKPVNDKTFVLARLLHIFIHVCKAVLPMAIPAFVYFIVSGNILSAIIFIILIVFATLFCIFLINAVYILILKITTPVKFKNIISYIQIFFAIFIYASYQLVPRLMDKTQLKHFKIMPNNLLLLAPPYWFACAHNLLSTFLASFIELIAAGFAFLLPVISIYIVIKYLAPSFNQKLSMISGSEGASGQKKKTVRQGKQSFSNRLSALLTNNLIEKTGFLFAWKMMARSRDFKVKVYPSVGYIIVIIVMMIFNNNKEGLNNLHANTHKLISAIIFGIYFSSILVLMAIMQMAYSDKFKAAWMFYITPVETPGEIVSGTIKALLLQFYLFIALIVLIIAVALLGVTVIPNVIVGICNQLMIIYSIINWGGYKNLPFSKSLSNAQRGGMFLRNMLMMIIAAIIGFIHYAFFKNTIALVVMFVISLTVVYFLMKNIKKTNWERIRIAAESL